MCGCSVTQTRPPLCDLMGCSTPGSSVHGISHIRILQKVAISFLIPGLPCGSAGKEFAWNAGYRGSIPGLGRSPAEGKGHPLQYSGLQNSSFKLWCWRRLLRFPWTAKRSHQSILRGINFKYSLEGAMLPQQQHTLQVLLCLFLALTWRIPWGHRVRHDWVTFTCHFLLQNISMSQVSNLNLLHWWQVSYHGPTCYRNPQIWAFLTVRRLGLTWSLGEGARSLGLQRRENKSQKDGKSKCLVNKCVPCYAEKSDVNIWY